MNEINFYYSKKKQTRLAVLFLLIALLGTAIAVYYFFFANHIVSAVTYGGIVLAILSLLIFFRLLTAPEAENEVAISINEKGIAGFTTPVIKSAGLIDWHDIASINVYDGMLEMAVHNPGKYAARMKNFFVRDSFLKTLKGTLKVSLVEVSAAKEEIMNAIEKYTSEKI
ncbi:STM3941 family protein [Niabella drilacis]|uniref:Uncharacterized protein n=1 Tax=Niabella drilacis (strain DSM 25811 / CCM 8410 / CCUG 62505 / LMG 26954 / E90) TaxID=1285928 RepID=A0A1G6TDP5_NIADE|nr:STM3941 family protein [Niabella drilacis]SDD27262.1 hypothetical protein SAMN04487894_107183 [Niabella drilacis]